MSRLFQYLFIFDCQCKVGRYCRLFCVYPVYLACFLKSGVNVQDGQFGTWRMKMTNEPRLAMSKMLSPVFGSVSLSGGKIGYAMLCYVMLCYVMFWIRSIRRVVSHKLEVLCVYNFPPSFLLSFFRSFFRLLLPVILRRSIR